MTKSNFLRCIAHTLILLTVLWITQIASPVTAQAIPPQATTPLTDQELVRNGTFDQGKTAWATNQMGTHVGDNYGTDGPGMQIWTETSNNYGYIFQELYLPTQVTAASLSFNYKFLPQAGATLGWFRARIATDTEDLAAPLYIDTSNYPGETWQTVTHVLTADELTAVNGARDAGKRVYVMIDLYAQFLYVNVDTISFKVSGSMEVPTLSGSIAYIGLSDDGYTQMVKLIDPNNSSQQTLWTHPYTISPRIYDVAWKPDTTELAFSSNHEFLHSAFHADVYGIQLDGSGLRRITNPPSRASLDTGNYQWGTVTGKIYNNYGTVFPFYIYIEGAQQVVSVDIAGQQSEVSFRVENVADLGPATSQYIVFHWSDTLNDCVSGKEYAAIAVSDVIAGQEVDVGTLTFQGNCYDYNSRSIAWKRDGSQVGYLVESLPKVVPASGEDFGDDLFNIGTVPAEDLAWSPAQANENALLYRRSTFDTNSGFYLTTVGGGIGTLKASDRKAFGSAIYATPAWLPDGSGFVYTLDNYLYEYTLSNSQAITLATFYNEYVDNPSVSPDGNYIIFERISTKAPLQYNLWLLNRRNPVEMWPLTNDGKSSNPDWSRTAPSSDTPISSLSISGAMSSALDVTQTFTASVSPANATQPITYTWQASGQSDVIHTDSGLSDSVSFSWSTTGTQAITVTAQNAANRKTAYHAILISHSSATPTIQINHPNGAPGSYFQVTGNIGAGMLIRSSNALLVNGQSVGNITTDAFGAFTVTLHTSPDAREGLYQVYTSRTPTVKASYRLDKNAPERLQEPGDVLQVPDTITPLKLVYLPLVLRN